MRALRHLVPSQRNALQIWTQKHLEEGGGGLVLQAGKGVQRLSQLLRGQGEQPPPSHRRQPLHQPRRPHLRPLSLPVPSSTHTSGSDTRHPQNERKNAPLMVLTSSSSPGVQQRWYMRHAVICVQLMCAVRSAAPEVGVDCGQAGQRGHDGGLVHHPGAEVGQRRGDVQPRVRRPARRHPGTGQQVTGATPALSIK
jgi:hypothetical protein